MLWVRGREAVGLRVRRAEEQEAKPADWFYDLRRFAAREKWYCLGRSLTDRERATAALDKVRTLD